MLIYFTHKNIIPETRNMSRYFAQKPINQRSKIIIFKQKSDTVNVKLTPRVNRIAVGILYRLSDIGENKLLNEEPLAGAFLFSELDLALTVRSG